MRVVDDDNYYSNSAYGNDGDGDPAHHMHVEDIALMNRRQRQGGGDVGGMTATTSSSSSSSSPPLVLKSNHLDYIHDIAFDTYGRRMASCSGDRFVRVWDLRGGGGPTTTSASAAGAAESSSAPPAGTTTGGAAATSPAASGAGVIKDAWACTAAWQAHKGSVTCLSWCHPEYGTLLATAGLDQEVKIWEERNTTIGGGGMGVATSTTPNNGGTPSSSSNNGASAASSSSHSNSVWTLRASLADAKRAVTCVAFAPRHYGLKLATASTDGIIRMYEAIDVVNIGSWPLSASLQVYGSGGAGGVDASHPDEHGSRSRQTGGGVGGGGGVSDSASSSSGQWLTLSWCTGRFDPPTIVVGGGSHPTAEAATASAAATNASTASSTTHSLVNALVIYRYMEGARAWLPLRILPRIDSSSNPTPGLSKSPALCVAWAPNVGRRYHYVAAAYGDALVVYKLKRSMSVSTAPAPAGAAAPGASASAATTSSSTDDLVLESTQVLPVTSAWRCQWNVTGTVLACSGDLGTVQLYKAVPHSNQFRLVSEIRHYDPFDPTTTGTG